jgi:hypothetical protein
MSIHLIPALIDSVVWFDVWMKKPLKKAIPNLEHLLSDPAGTLPGQEIEIPPDRRLGSALFMALVASPAMCCLSTIVSFLVGSTLPPQWGPDRNAIGYVSISLLMAPILSLLVTLRLFRGGTCLLSAKGIELKFRRRVVFCPWSLFAVQGLILAPKRNRILVPIDTEQVPHIQVWKNKPPSTTQYYSDEPSCQLLAEGQSANTRQLKLSKEGDHVVLKDLYAVKLRELGELFLVLGRALG